MNRVPDGKKVYIGSRKFISGQPLPPYVLINDPDDIPFKTEIKKESLKSKPELKPKSTERRGRPKKIIEDKPEIQTNNIDQSLVE